MADKIDWDDLVVEKFFIGFGTYGDVHKAVWKTKDGPKQIVVKKFRHCIGESAINKEVSYLSLVKHANIVTLYGTSTDCEKRTILLMEYADCGSVYDILHNIPVDQNNIPYTIKLNWMVQLAKAIEYLHGRSPAILHRDLKPPNLLLFNKFSILKICDFGTVKHLATKMTGSVGTASYMAPEVNDMDSYTEKCDVYSFGVTLWEVMSGKKPFYHLGKAVDLFIQRKAFEGDRPAVEDIQSFKNSDQITELIENCWNGDSEKRPTMNQVLEILISLHEECEVISETLSITSSNTKYESPVFRFGELQKNYNIKWKDIELGKFIGQGIYGDIYFAKWKTQSDNNIIVAKIYRFLEKSSFKQLKVLEHENIITLYDISKDDYNRTVLLEEYADCGSLENVLHGNECKMSYSYFDALKWMHQCVKGMAFIHKQNNIYRNLKPSKLLLMNKFQRVKISYSDVMTEFTTHTMTKMTGTVFYMAPEVFNGERYSEKCDVFSFGILLWEVMARKKPFNKADNTYMFLENIANGVRPDLHDANIFMGCDVLKELMKKCWHSEPVQRPSMHELQSYLGDILLAL